VPEWDGEIQGFIQREGAGYISAASGIPDKCCTVLQLCLFIALADLSLESPTLMLSEQRARRVSPACYFSAEDSGSFPDYSGFG